MGVLDDAAKKVKQAAEVASDVAEKVEKAQGKGSTKTGAKKKGPVWGSRDPDKADYGKAGAPPPDMDSLVTDAEIEEVTGAKPKGEPRRNGKEGSDGDLGRHIIRESKLENGDKFLISVNNCTNASMAQLAMERVATYEKKLDGVGEQGLKRVKRYKSGKSEVGVRALKENFNLTLVHTSGEGKTDPGPLTELLTKAVARL